MNNVLNKFEQINERMNSDKIRQARLLEMEATYNRAIKKGLINKPLYDIPDALQMETSFLRKNKE